MHLINEMELPTLPVEHADFLANPDRYLEAARREHPWLARCSQGVLVHGYHAANVLLADDKRLRPAFNGFGDFYGLQGTMWARFMEENVLAKHGAEHARIRRSIADAFTPRRANQIRPLMQQIVSDLLDEWAPLGKFDFAEFASFYPVAVICGLLGISSEHIPKIRTALGYHTASLSLDLEVKPLIMAGWDVVWSFADEVVLGRKKSNATDEDSLLDVMIAAKNSGELDDTELRFMLLTLMYAGYDTSKNQLTVIMHLLLQRPEIYARCAADKAFCSKVIEEALRYLPIASTYRSVVETFEHDGVQFSEGTMVIIALPVAGRDPAAFPDPLTFDPERSHASRQIGFGRGAHMCVGQFIARALLEEGLHQVAKRLKGPRMNGEIAWRPFLGAWGLKTLPITFDAERPFEPVRQDTSLIIGLQG